MDNVKKIGLLMVAIAVIVVVFGLWVKTYNDKIAWLQTNQTGSCYLPDGTCLHATSDIIFYSSLGIALFLAALGFYLLLKKNEPKKVIIKRMQNGKAERQNEKATKEIEAPKTLNPETKNIFDLIVSSNGAILQGELVAKSNMDKVKVSRILDKLEMLGLIERRRHGMSNLVVLKKK